jgi:exodeoxyribonuclease V alpha subunit
MKPAEPADLVGFSDLDRHFGRLMTELARQPSEALRLAGALVSHQRGKGHSCLDLTSVAGRRLGEVLGNTEAPSALLPALAAWKESLRASGVVGSPGEFTPLVLDAAGRLYLHRYWHYETNLAASIRSRSCCRVPVDEVKLEASLQRFFPPSGDEFDWQRHAIRTAATRAFTVITGGPGTGKTRTVVWLLAALLEQDARTPLRIALAAPTGKAAARIAESVRMAKAELPCTEALKAKLPEKATTIHRLLGAIPNSPRFRHDAANLLAVDVVVVDEASMVDLALMAKLFAAVPPTARVVLVGDQDQLASVEAGNVLGEICAGEDSSTASPLAGGKVELRKNWRFNIGSEIQTLSQAVNTGDATSVLSQLRAAPATWRSLPRPTELPPALKETVLTNYGAVLRVPDPAKALSALNRFRLLAAVRRGPFGVENLNALCEALLERGGLIQRQGVWYAGRPVMVTRNDATLRLFNGDVGITLPDDNGELRVFFADTEGAVRAFAPPRLPEHETVFAMTVHKSQGSEFDRVLLVLPERDSPVLTRELLYTGLTRAKSGFEVWADESILRSAIGRRVQRASGLRDALMEK